MRIVFLDIDGVMVHAGTYLINPHASHMRQFCPNALACLNYLLETADAKLVTNSIHNREHFMGFNAALEMVELPLLRDSLIAAGIPAERFHTDWRTTYPVQKRKNAVLDWLDENEGFNEAFEYVVLDDEKMSLEKLIWVDPWTGLTYRHVDQALDLFNVPYTQRKNFLT